MQKDDINIWANEEVKDKNFSNIRMNMQIEDINIWAIDEVEDESFSNIEVESGSWIEADWND